MRKTCVPRLLGTQMSPNASAAGNGPWPTAILPPTVFVAGSIQATLFSPLSGTKTTPFGAIAGLAGWSPDRDGRDRPVRRRVDARDRVVEPVGNPDRAGGDGRRIRALMADVDFGHRVRRRVDAEHGCPALVADPDRPVAVAEVGREAVDLDPLDDAQRAGIDPDHDAGRVVGAPDRACAERHVPERVARCDAHAARHPQLARVDPLDEAGAVPVHPDRPGADADPARTDVDRDALRHLACLRVDPGDVRGAVVADPHCAEAAGLGAGRDARGDARDDVGALGGAGCESGGQRDECEGDDDDPEHGDPPVEKVRSRTKLARVRTSCPACGCSARHAWRGRARGSRPRPATTAPTARSRARRPRRARRARCSRRRLGPRG